MKPILLSCFVYLSLLAVLSLSSCGDIIEPSISKSNVQPEAPADSYMSTSYTINFWWDPVNNALTYHLQVVSATFAAPGGLVLDTIVKQNKFSFNMNPGNYQWRVMAENGSSQTPFTAPRSFSVAATSIKQQSVQLASPGNNSVTNQAGANFQWGSLYGATQYRFEIDTNNFANESAVVANQVIPGQQYSFTFLKDQVYQWRVRAENDTAISQWSTINVVTFDHTPPPAVSLIAPTSGQVSALPVSLQWASSPGAVKYKVYVFKSDSVSLYNSTFPVQVTSTSYSFNLGNSGDKVYWQVTALDAAGNESAPSTERSFVLQ